MYIPDSPTKARYLTARERKVAKLRLQDEKPNSASHEPERRGIRWKEILQTLADPKCYLTAVSSRFRASGSIH